MEKLAPIIKQKFWILLGVGLVMTFTGWWLATGTLAATVKARVEKVNGAFGKVPSGEIPNNDWSTKLAARNTEQDRAVRNTASLLWERQLSRMAWPSNIATFTRNVPYRGEIPLAARENYRIDYSWDVKRVWESVRPYIQADGTGIVVFGSGPQVLQQKKWGALAPSSADMWDAQEDLWLMESLLQSIVDVNGGREAQRGDASIHAIEKLELFGGIPAAQRKTAPAASAAGPGGSMMSPGGGHGMGGSGGGGSPGGFGGAPGGSEGLGGRPAAATLASADFDRREEFGDDGSGKGAGLGGSGGGFGGGPGGGSASAHGSAGGMPGPGGGTAGTGGTAAANAIKRYIEDDAASPFKTRGFYMTLIMDHRKIPSLIAELSASEKSAWPVEVVRIQMVRLHDDDIGSGVGGGGGSGPGGYPGGGGSGKGFSLSNILSGGGGGSGPGFGGTGPSYDGGDFAGAPSSSSPSYGQPGAAGGNLTTSPAAAGLAALESALQDPFMARVAVCGFITLYKEVKPDPIVTTPGTPAAPAGTTPAAPAAMSAEPDVTTPEGSPEGTPAEGDAPAESNPAKPADPSATTPPDATGDTPTPPAGTEASPETPKSP